MPRKRETLRLGSLRKIKVTDKKKLFEQNGFKLVLAVDRSFHLNIHLQLLTTHSLSHQLWNINKMHKVAVYTQSTITTFITYRDVSLNIFKLFISA